MASFNTTVRQMTKTSQQKLTEMFQQRKQLYAFARGLDIPKFNK